jgi:HAD superfamily hydrolase (TIGR01549 family)
MSSNQVVHAVIWDYDGTLVDTRQKNLNVTRKIVKSMAGIDPMTIPALQTIEQYMLANTRALNWRDFYSREFHLTDEQIDAAGRAWTEFQQEDTTPTPLFDGIKEVVEALRALPHGVVSQNSKLAISAVLQGCGLLPYFRAIIGYEEIDLRHQKPAPDGVLLCIKELVNSEEGLIIYVGDHETDARCASNAAAALRGSGSGIELKSIAILHLPDSDTSRWSVKPDYEARNTLDIARIILGKPWNPPSA